MERFWLSYRLITVVLLLLSRCCQALRRSNFAVQPHPIQFNEEPEDWTVSVGSNVSLTCNTSVVQIVGYLDEERTPSPQIEWIHNNVTISSGGHYTINNSTISTSILTITNVTLVEQGDYHCLVNDWKKEDGGWWTSTRIIDHRTRSLSINEAENVVLTCLESVAGNETVWMKDGVEMSGPLTDGDGNLLLFGIVEDDTGHYQCNSSVGEVSVGYFLNVEGYSNSGQLEKPLLFDINYVETHFVKINKDIPGCQDVSDIQSVSLHCNATSYEEMIWYKNGQLLDVNSSDIVFNQTTSNWTITKNNPCDLLGVYQCFVSNEVGTVHVSTRVLPLGWPNHPGSLELLSHKGFSKNFNLSLKLCPTDYTGGLSENDIYYNIYLASPLLHFDILVTRNVHINNVTFTADVESHNHLFGEQSIANEFNFYAEMRVDLSYDTSGLMLSRILALPLGSPFLSIRHFCELLDYPPPVVEETCHYDDTGDFVTYELSWRVEGNALGFVFAENVQYWIIVGNCSAPNGTTILPFNVWLQENTRSFLLPVNSTCSVSITYYTNCNHINQATSVNITSCNNNSGIPGIAVNMSDNTNSTSKDQNGEPSHATTKSTLFTVSKDEWDTKEDTVTMNEESGSDDDTVTMNEESGSDDGSGANIVMIIGVSSAGVVIIIIITITVALAIMYWKCAHHEPSAMDMLNSAHAMKKLQMVSPVSIGQQSFIGSDAHSDFYFDDKVATWLGQLPLENQSAVVETQFNDSQSLFDTISVCTSDMLRQITQGRSASNVSLTLANRNAILDGEVPSPSSEESRYSSAFLAMFNGADVPTVRQPVEQKSTRRDLRLLSADSGVGSTYGKAAAAVHHVIIHPHPPLLESVADETIHCNMSVSDIKLVSQYDELLPAFSSSEGFSEVQLDTSSGTTSPEHRSDSGVSGNDMESTLKTGKYIGLDNINKEEYSDLVPHQGSSEVQLDTSSSTTSPEHRSDSGVSGYDMESTLKTGKYIGLDNINKEEYSDLVPHQGSELCQHDGLLCHHDKSLCHHGQPLCHCDKPLCHHDECECRTVTVNVHASSHDPVEQQNYTFNDDGYVTNPQSS
ncbi:uncharacterized protein [Dysidea avara]|uniref:uncharacterized protein isoform X2 n=1 Tax=Dysidea avara TaxID=196820 RepID=UPI00331EEF84